MTDGPVSGEYTAFVDCAEDMVNGTGGIYPPVGLSITRYRQLKDEVSLNSGPDILVDIPDEQLVYFMLLIEEAFYG
jgi:hypothetical protein